MTLLPRTAARLAAALLVATAVAACGGGGDQTGDSFTENQQNQVPSPGASQ